MLTFDKLDMPSKCLGHDFIEKFGRYSTLKDASILLMSYSKGSFNCSTFPSEYNLNFPYPFNRN